MSDVRTSEPPPVSLPATIPGAVSLTPPVLMDATGEKPVQATLFDDRMFIVRPELVKMVKEKSFVHSGAIITKDELLCKSVCIDLHAGLSGRMVAKKYQLSRNTVLAIERVMRERGELEPLKKVTSDLLGDCIYLGLERYREALAAGEVPPTQIPIPVAALIDKKGQLDAGVVPGTELAAPPAISPEKLKEQWEAMKKANVTDIQSVTSVEKPQ